MTVRIDMVGQAFGRLTVESFADTRRGRCWWTCVCTCGTRKAFDGVQLRDGTVVSCGCWRRSQHLRHGHARNGRQSPEYACWASMVARCENPDSKAFAYYGGRGITVCERWRNSFEAFLADMGRRPSSKHSIDRFPDMDGNYEPENCRWATWTEQARNTRQNLVLTHDGVTACLTEWAERVGICPKTLQARLSRGWTVARALTQPVQHRGARPTSTAEAAVAA